MPTLTIDGRAVEVDEGATVLVAASKLGIRIPTLCLFEGLRPETSCLVCVVRIGTSAKLVPACATKAVEGMAVESETEEIHTARRTALELLLGDHLGDCLGPCHPVCPAQMDIPRMIRLIAAGRMDEAAAVVRERIPLPSVLGRICPEFCERACRRNDVDSPVAIRLLKRYVGDYEIASPGSHAPERRPPTGKKAAVIGGGPAGLSAAYYLTRDGHACTLLDDREALGGMLREAVPEEALSRDVLDAEIDAIVGLGIEVRLGTRVGRDVSLDDLRESFDAILVATGELSESGEEALGLPVASGRVKADRSTHMTDAEGIFVAGSALSPSKHTVRGVGSGRTAAESISEYLAGGPVTGAARPFNVRMGALEAEELAAYAAEASEDARVLPELGEPGGFTPAEAVAEAGRCLRCDCAGLEGCRLRLWATEYGADPRRYREEPRAFERDLTHPSLVYESGKCISCGLCVQIARDAGEPLGLAHVGRGFTVRVGVPLSGTLAEGLETTARRCAEACPTGALVMRDD